MSEARRARTRVPRSVPLWFALAALTGMAGAASVPVGADTATWSVSVSGDVTAQAGSSSEAPVPEYRTETDGDSNSEGPWKIGFNIPEAKVFGKNGGASIYLNITKPLEPGEYTIHPNTKDDTAVQAVVYVDSPDIDMGLKRAAFSSNMDGTLTIERLDQEVATGRFTFRAENARKEPEAVEVSGTFEAVPYQFTPQFQVEGSGGFKGVPISFNRGSATRTDDGLRLSISKKWGLSLEFNAPPGDGTRVIELGPDKPGSVTLQGEPGTGTLSITRAGETLAGEFKIEATLKGTQGTLSGTFDYLPVE